MRPLARDPRLLLLRFCAPLLRAIATS
jgi:hypothetical protein